MEITRLAALSDNYIFVLSDQKQKIAAVVDPASSQPVLELLHRQKLQLVAIFNTHHHRDHVGGNQDLIEQFPQVCVYGGSEDQGRIPGQQVFLKDGDRVTFADRFAEVLFVPGHTRAHIAYYFPPQNDSGSGELFCGDTIFSGGCGRLFEGTPAQMVASLTKLRSLPDQTRVWCAHEYTLKNLQFALTVDPNNADLHKRYQFVKTARHNAQATIPTWLGVEKQTNPFLRWDSSPLQSAMQTTDPIQTFARLRGQKEQF
ncbi:hydroxyacylglutathione hydrolase [Chroococcus sp. FPU101]|uniref:hydroxyacylglutathione hydrolase n=1 Tax=Chroococcus sp. FPU101 TaxID=1974212 RepID=UPI001A8D523E|nr:hydroxyacylglutathione hydrolase [Chroococcus sp. FPU101]GFE70213.1 putative glyoxalase II [Chroococcus sp. FPU101]